MMSVALAATLVAGLAVAAAKSPGGAKACVNGRNQRRLLAGTSCPKGEQPTTLGQRGPRGPRGRAARPDHDYVAEATAQTSLPTTKNTVKTVARLDSLPPGSWVFTTEATVVNFGQADYFRCKIVVGKKQIASGASTVGTPAGAGARPGVPSGAATVANIGLIGTAVESKTFSAALRCWHDLKTPKKNAAPYIDPGAVMLGRPAGKITGATS